MKVYLCVQSEYEGSEAFRVCKSKKKAEYIVNQANRLFEVCKGLRELDRNLQIKYWNDNPQLIDSTRVENYYSQKEHKKIDKIERKAEDLLELLGANGFYMGAHVEERKLE